MRPGAQGREVKEIRLPSKGVRLRVSAGMLQIVVAGAKDPGPSCAIRLAGQ
jgi:hypothetical protein